MLILVITFLIMILSIFGVIKNSKNFLFFILYIEIVLISITYLISLIYSTQGSYFGQIYGLFILTIAAIESAIIVSLVVQFYRYRGTVSVNIINYKLEK